MSIIQTTDFNLIQTEKAYLVQEKNTYLIQFVQKNFHPNKIEVTKLLKKQGYTPLKVTIVNQYKKLKRRGARNNLVPQSRPKKYYVRLKQGEKIAEPNKN